MHNSDRTIDFNLAGTLTIKEPDMTAIRNSSVARGVAAASASTLVYTVPTGFVFLLKNIIVTPAGRAPSTIIMQITAIPENNQTEFYNHTTIQGENVYWSGWTAMNQTDRLIIYTSPVAANYNVSGALLPFAPGL